MSLDERLAAIGLMISSRALSQGEVDSVDIEETLVDAMAEAGASSAGLRFFPHLLTWVECHGQAVIVEKLWKVIKRKASVGLDMSHVPILAAYAVSLGMSKWAKILVERKDAATRTSVALVPLELAESLASIRGNEAWAEKYGYVIPRGSAETKKKWVMDRAQLAKFSRPYRNRLLYGAQWRADIVTAVEAGARTAAEVSRITGASYQPCHRVLKDLADAGVTSWVDGRRAEDVRSL